MKPRGAKMSKTDPSTDANRIPCFYPGLPLSMEENMLCLAKTFPILFLAYLLREMPIVQEGFFFIVACPMVVLFFVLRYQTVMRRFGGTEQVVLLDEEERSFTLPASLSGAGTRAETFMVDELKLVKLEEFRGRSGGHPWLLQLRCKKGPTAVIPWTALDLPRFLSWLEKMGQRPVVIPAKTNGIVLLAGIVALVAACLLMVWATM